MTLTKAQIAEMIAEKNGFPQNKSTELVESLIEIIKSSLENGEDVLVSGFGKFCVKSKGQRRGRNPATGSDLIGYGFRIHRRKFRGFGPKTPYKRLLTRHLLNIKVRFKGGPDGKAI